MAGHGPRQQGPPPPLHEFPPLGPNSPPDHSLISTPNGPNRHNISNGGRSQHRHSSEYRHNLPNGSKAIPTAPHARMGGAGPRPFGGGGGFDGARSPPNTKNTSHVPCKFFKQGQCQAGSACPFSHSLDASKFEQPCKYFSKGNCKFGQKCALLHVLPNGRVVNRGNGGAGMGQLNIGNRVEPAPYHHQESALGNSLMAQQANSVNQPFGHQLPILSDQDPNAPAPMHVQSQPFDIPQPSISFGTPRDEVRQPKSPPTHLSTLDAPLPASFDSNGLSYMARYGPVAASVPSKFGFESSPPPASLPKKANVPSDTLRNLHDSAYGGSNKATNLGTSPFGPFGEGSGQRIMHSQRVSKPRMISSSLPRPALHHDEFDEDFFFESEENLLPSDLSQMLGQDDKQRRPSVKAEDPLSVRASLMGDHTPAEVTSKVGSPSTASPSRFSALFNKQKREEEQNGPASSSFGPVGSPLRNSSLHLGTSPSMRAVSRTSGNDLAFHVSSPPRHSSTSVLSQQLQRTRLSRPESGEGTPSLHPLSGRHASNPRTGYDRAVSSSSVNTNRIDEEFVFSLDEEDYNTNTNKANPSNSRNHLGSIGDGRHSLGSQAGDDKESKGIKVPQKKSQS